MATGLATAKTKLEQDIRKIIDDAFHEAIKTTFTGNQCELGDAIADAFGQKAAEKAAGPLADAIYDFVTQGQIVGTINGVVTGSCAAGPVSGSNIDALTGAELSIT